MKTIWYVLLRLDSQTPIMIHWDKGYIEQNSKDKNYRIVAVCPVDKDGNFLHLPLINKDETIR